MTRTYECMFLIDNDAVRAGWQDAKGTVTGLIEKHGGKPVTARRWAERRLAYPIRHKNRATYMLSYCELQPQTMNELRRDLDISEAVLRYLLLSVDEIPQEEHQLSAEENDSSFTVPEPPADDAIDEPPPSEEEEGAEGTPKAEGEAKPAEGEAKPAEGEAAAEAPAATESTDENTKKEGEEG